MRSCCQLVLLLILGFEFSNAQSLEHTLSESKTWHRLLHYKKPWFRSIKGDVVSPEFYFSKDGHKNPYKELLRTVEQMQQNPQFICQFPARHDFLYKNLSNIPKRPKCKDFDAWFNSLGATSLHLGFAGPYRGNPASILGHSFLVLGRDQTELLSYALGFSAQPDPRDSKPVFMWKGITGGYPGMYQLEPYYMRVGVYNNAEHRDIWLHKIPLKQDQIDFIIFHIWELIQKVQIPYYFVDENCSYRMIELIDLAFKDLNLMTELSTIVLPGDTIKLSIDQKIAEPKPQFRASIQRKLDWLIAGMKKQEVKQYKKQLKQPAPKYVHDPEVLDALILQWNINAYEAHGQLSNENSQLRMSYLKQRSKLPASILVSDEDIRQKWELLPIYYGHPTSWLRMGMGEYEQGDENSFWDISYRTGSHAWHLPNKAYEEAANIEYLGFDLRQSEANDRWDWNLLLIDVLSVNPWTWGFHASANNTCQICKNRRTHINLKGGYGLGFNSSRFSGFIYPAIDARLLYNESNESLVGAGLRLGARTHWSHWTFAGNYEHIYHKDDDIEEFNLSMLYSWNLKQHIQIQSQKNEHSLSFIVHF